MASINSITISGRAGADPEIRYQENGTQVANLRIAVDQFGRDRKPMWLSVKIWGRSAQVAADYVRKGSQVGISGRLEEETWTDRQSGQERSKPVVNCSQLTLLGSPKDQQGQGQQADAGGWGGGDQEMPF